MKFILTGMGILLLAGIAAANAQDEYEKWLKQEKEKFAKFKEEDDKKFTDFLKKDWEKMQVFKGVAVDETPKPVVLPKAPPKPAEKEPVTGPTVKLMPIPEPKKTEPVVPPSPPPAAKKDLASARIDFYGSQIEIPYSESLRISFKPPVNGASIAAFWEALAKAPCADLLGYGQSLKTSYGLNDWGYVLLLYTTANTLYGGRRNEAALFTWFALLKSGYDAKLGYAGDNVYLLLASSNTLFGTSYYTLDGKRYYAVRFAHTDPQVKGSIYTYTEQYAGAKQAVAMAVPIAPQLKNGSREKTFAFSYNNIPYSIKVTLSEGPISFFEYYPQTDYEQYFASVPSPVTRASLLQALRPIVSGKPEGEAVNILLRFVQTAFDYKTDDQQFGREKTFFVEETLFYPFSDCEDRSILFAFLVKNLLGLDVVGLNYPGHIATAVRFSADVKGDHVMIDGTKYTICDPTYINADFGMTMPAVADQSFTLIRF